MPTIDLSKMDVVVSDRSIDRLMSARLGQVLVLQAKRRMDAGGDSEFQYPELWGHPKSYRADGQPLLDTRVHIQDTLSDRAEQTRDGVRYWLVGPLIAIYHQFGFTTKGPNFIPLTMKAKRTHVPGVNPDDEDLVDGEDYIIAWAGVTVPQRKIFNLPPENVAEFAAGVVDALR